ncbi:MULTISPECIES: hypothetical protein, partial [unclassified Microcoleus]|uniref:hypothetical protein n=1 Tax=unclassified Microcoleus TaxID=2642155 RepID=UPI002FD78DFD
MTFGRSQSIRTILFRAARFDRAMLSRGTADNLLTTHAHLIVYCYTNTRQVSTFASYFIGSMGAVIPQ